MQLFYPEQFLSDSGFIKPVLDKKRHFWKQILQPNNDKLSVEMKIRTIKYIDASLCREKRNDAEEFASSRTSHLFQKRLTLWALISEAYELVSLGLLSLFCKQFG